MPKHTPSSDLASVRAKIPQKSVAEWKQTFQGASLAYLNQQASCLKYNESLPYPPIHLRAALKELIKEAKERGDTVPRPLAASRILPAPDDIEYERVESGAGKGATVLIPKI
jgi:hypothetical protein